MVLIRGGGSTPGRSPIRKRQKTLARKGESDVPTSLVYLMDSLAGESSLCVGVFLMILPMKSIFVGDEGVTEVGPGDGV